MTAPVSCKAYIAGISLALLLLPTCLRAQAEVQKPLGAAQAATALPAADGLAPELAQVVDAARQTPPEFHALALLLVVESGRVQALAVKLSLLREALETAQLAVEPMNQELALNGVVVESEAGVWMFKRRFALDRTSLMARAVADAEKLAPVAARAMLEDAHWVAVEPAACSHALVGDPEAYYKLLEQLARNHGNQKDGKDSTLQLLEPAVSSLKSHRQMELALRLLSQVELSQEQRETLARRLTVQLAEIQGDDRGFAALLLERNFNGWLQSLKRDFEHVDEGTAHGILREFRGYLVENLKAGGCGASWLRRKDANGQLLLPKGVEAFNLQLHSELERAGLEPITLAEIVSGAPESAAVFKAYGKNEQARALTTAAVALRFDTKNQRRTLEDLNSTGWADEANRFLGKVDDWQVDPFNSAEAFWMKMGFYTGVIDLAPQVDLRWQAMEKAVSLLENSRLETEDPALLMVFTFQLHIRATSQMNGEVREARNGRELTKRLAGSRNPTLRLLELLEKDGMKPIPDSF